MIGKLYSCMNVIQTINYLRQLSGWPSETRCPAAVFGGMSGRNAKFEPIGFILSLYKKTCG